MWNRTLLLLFLCPLVCMDPRIAATTHFSGSYKASDRTSWMGVFPNIDGFKERHFRELEATLRSSTATDPSAASPEIIKNLLTRSDNPKLVIFGHSDKLSVTALRYDRLCAKVTIDCIIFVIKDKGVENIAALDMKTLTLSLPLESLPDFVDRTNPDSIYVFDASGSLIWFSPLLELGSTVEIIVKTLLSAQLTQLAGSFDGPSQDGTSQESYATAEILPANDPATGDNPTQLLLADLANLVVPLDAPNHKQALAKTWAAKEALSKRRPLLFIFWGTWCAPCVEEIPDLVELNKVYPDVIFMGLLDDLNTERNRRLANELAIQKGFKTQYIMSDNSLLRRIFGDQALPAFALFNGDGSLTRYRFTGAIRAARNSHFLEQGLREVTAPRKIAGSGRGGREPYQFCPGRGQEALPDGWSSAKLDKDVLNFLSRLSASENSSVESLIGRLANHFFAKNYPFEDFSHLLSSLRVLIESEDSYPPLQDDEPRLLDKESDKPPLVLYLDPTCDSCGRVLKLLLKANEICPDGIPPVVLRVKPSSDPASLDSATLLLFLKDKSPDQFLEAFVEMQTNLPHDKTWLTEAIRIYAEAPAISEIDGYNGYRLQAESLQKTGICHDPPCAYYAGRRLKRAKAEQSAVPIDPFRDTEVMLEVFRIAHIYDKARMRKKD